MRTRKRKRKKSGCLLGFLLLLAFGGAGAFAYNSGILGTAVRELEGTVREVPFQEVRIEEESLGQKYYYGQLEEEEKKVYQEIRQGLIDYTSEIYVHTADAARANQIFQYVLNDHPEIFWCDGKTTATSYGGITPYTVLEPAYLYREEEKEKRSAVIESAAGEYLSGISEDASDYEKILYVYESIISRVEYVQDAPDNQNIYSVFSGRQSVCAGYAKATQYLLERLGVFCTYVTGTAAGGQAHAWNLVSCGGDYYYVDTTWGDPVFQASEGGESKVSGHISYDYMCCNDEQLFMTHTPDDTVELPACTKMDANYYVVNGMYYETYDSAKILEQMNEVISAGENPAVIKFADEKLYQEAHEDILNHVVKRAAQNLAEWYGLTQVSYQYMDEESLHKITIYWEYS